MFQHVRPGDPTKALSEDFTESSQQYLSRTRRVLILRSLVVGVPHRFDQFSPAVVMDDMLAMVHEDPTAPITLIIDSPGGNIDDGMMLYDFIRLSPAPVTTVGLNCASMATVLLAAGKTRLILPHSSLCLHMLMATVKGDIKDVQIRTKELERTMEELVSCYIKCGVTAAIGVPASTRKRPLSAAELVKRIRAKILKDIDREFYLNAEEAVAYGLVDRVVTTEELFGRDVT